jgi:alpha-glucuronidase
MNRSIGEKVLVWDAATNCKVQAKIISIHTEVKCCERTDNFHTHDVTYDVQMESGNISHGHLPHGIFA